MPRATIRAARCGALVLVAALSSPARVSGGTDDATMPHPAPQAARSADPARANERCVGCHAAIATEWAASMHAQADTDPVYARALSLEPLPFCRGCHAPEADPRADAREPLASVGVGCVTCHVTGPDPRGGTLSAVPTRGVSPHAVRLTARFASDAACAGCHEFDFPARVPGQPPDRMQATVSEHSASSRAAEPCAACHMPVVGGDGPAPHRSHLFAASRDPALLRAAVRVTTERPTASSLVVTLEPGRVGHAFPTGDLFRRLIVSAEALGDDWTVIGEASRSLHRRFAWREVAPGQAVRHMVGDDRVGVGPPVPLGFELGEAARGRAIAWRVEYQRVEHPVAADDSDAVVAESIVVAEGLVPARESDP